MILTEEFRVKRHHMKILIVDDDERIVRSTAVYLKTKGFNLVDTLTDSREVLKKLLEGGYDVILLDLNMPYMSGQTLIQSIKLLQIKTQIFIISAIDNKNSIAKTMEMGASDYYIKPINYEKLVQSLIGIKTQIGI